MKNQMTSVQHVNFEFSLIVADKASLVTEAEYDNEQAELDAHRKAVEASWTLDLPSVKPSLLEGATEVIVENKVRNCGFDDTGVSLPGFPKVNLVSMDLDRGNCRLLQLIQEKSLYDEHYDGGDDFLSVPAGAAYAEKRDGVTSIFMVKEAIPGQEQYIVLKLTEESIGAKMMEDINAALDKQEKDINFLRKPDEEDLECVSGWY